MTMTTPARIPSVSKWAVTALPIAEADAPSATNTVAKPATNTADSATTRQFGRQFPAASLCLRSARLMPARNHRYGGPSGRTQGDRKDNSPAASAPVNESEETTAV